MTRTPDMGRTMSNKKKFSAVKLGVIIMAISAVCVLASFYLLIFGARVQAECTDIKSAKSQYVLVYTYSVDGKEYKTTERIDRDDLKDDDRESKKVIYLKQVPSVTYDVDFLIISGVSFAFGFGFFYLCRKRNNSGD